MSWPPPPDLNSIKELVQSADTEGFIALHSAAADEYDGEAEALFAEIGRWPTSQITDSNLLPVIERIWNKNFDYDDIGLEKARPNLLSLAQQIARFFGPEAQPQVREQGQST